MMKCLLTMVAAVAGLFASTIVRADTLSVCGHSVEYKVDLPAADVPANWRGFSGVWVGNSDFGMCLGLIVESIKSDGTAKVLRINGPFGGGMPVVPRAYRFDAKLEGAKLWMTPPGFQFTYVLRSPAELAVTASGAQSTYTGALKKQQ